MGTALNYVALRLLGVPAEHPVIIRARGTLHKLGGQLKIMLLYPLTLTILRWSCRFRILGQILAFCLKCL